MARKEVDKGRSRRIPVTALRIAPRLPVCLLPQSFANSLKPGVLPQSSIITAWATLDGLLQRRLQRY